MRSKFARLGVVAAGLLALIGGITPPAQATTVGAVVFTGTATLDGPLGYPCADSTQPDLNFPKCPQGTLPGSGGSPLILTTNSLPLDILDITNPLSITTTVELGQLPYIHGGNARGVSFGSLVCVTAGVNVLKPGKPTTHANAGCSIAASGTVRGWCGLSTGKTTGTATDGLGQTYAIDTHFYGVGSMLFVNGHYTKANGDKGWVRGVVNATPPPGPGTPPTNSCSSKTATTFIVTGAVALVGVTS